MIRLFCNRVIISVVYLHCWDVFLRPLDPVPTTTFAKISRFNKDPLYNFDFGKPYGIFTKVICSEKLFAGERVFHLATLLQFVGKDFSLLVIQFFSQW